MVANSTRLRVEGTVATKTNSAGTATGTTGAFDANDCFDATNLSTAPATCSSDAPTFSASMPLVNATDVYASRSTLEASLKTMQELKTLGVSADQ